MSQHPLFSMPPAAAATVTVTVTRQHIDQAAAQGLHPVSLAILDSVPGVEDADVIRDGAYAWSGGEVKLLRFGAAGTAFVSACDSHEAVSPAAFEAEVIQP